MRKSAPEYQNFPRGQGSILLNANEEKCKDFMCKSFQTRNSGKLSYWDHCVEKPLVGLHQMITLLE